MQLDTLFSSFIFLNLLAALLGVIAGLVNSWAAARFHETNSAHWVQAIASLGGLALIFAFEALTHKWMYLSGLNLLSMFAVQRLVRFKIGSPDAQS